MPPAIWPDVDAELYDRSFRALHTSSLMRRLFAEAMGDQYPAEVEPFSSCCWWLLGRLVGGLRLGPDDVLADLGCGRGGLYELWHEHADGLRSELGADVTADLLAEADGNTDLANRETVLYVARAPGLPPASGRE
jgi:hypothetical protein